MRVAVLADTHIPSRAAALPKWVQTELTAADHVIHAGDFDSTATYEQIRELATDLTAVRGNMDPGLGLETVVTRQLAGVDFVVTHGTGSPRQYETRVQTIVTQQHPGAIGIAGHTHELLDTTVDGTRLLNPGSATGADPADRATMYRLAVSDEAVHVTPLIEGEAVED